MAWLVGLDEILETIFQLDDLQKRNGVLSRTSSENAQV